MLFLPFWQIKLSAWFFFPGRFVYIPLYPLHFRARWVFRIPLLGTNKALLEFNLFFFSVIFFFRFVACSVRVNKKIFQVSFSSKVFGYNLRITLPTQDLFPNKYWNSTGNWHVLFSYGFDHTVQSICRKGI